jgi:phospho-N-acetylmuramoyl-pentapeptide-transferase
MKFRRQKQKTVDMFNKPTPTFDKFNNWKAGTPFGGGMLIVVVVSVLTFWAYGILGVQVNGWQIAAIMLGFVGFGLLGLYDDLKKLVGGQGVFFGLRFRHKFVIQWTLAFAISSILYFKLGYSFILSGVLVWHRSDFCLFLLPLL